MARSKSRASLLLQEWRTKSGKSQTECAKAVDVSQPTWSEWENGGATPQGRYMAKILVLTDGFVSVASWADPADESSPRAAEDAADTKASA